MSKKIKSYTTWLKKVFLKLINTKTNSGLQHKNQQNYIDVKYTVHNNTPQLTSNDMLKVP